jgi:hypothetical protein
VTIGLTGLPDVPGEADRRDCEVEVPLARGVAAGDHGQRQPGHGAGRGSVRLSRASSVRPLTPGAKLFHTNENSTLYLQWTDFSELRAYHDPKGKFTNPFLDRLV